MQSRGRNRSPIIVNRTWPTWSAVIEELPSDWRRRVAEAVVEAVPCVPGVAVILIAGVLFQHVGAALIAAGGAMSIGFGSSKTIEGSPLPATFTASLAAACAAFAGSLAGADLAALAVAAFLAAAVCTFFAAVDEGVRWILLQAAIALLIAGNFPTSLIGAASRGGLILGGGLLELAFLSVLQRFLHTASGPLWPLVPGPSFLRRVAAKAREELHHNLLHSGLCGLAVAASLVFSRGVDMPKSYWAPMTTLIVLKADYRSIGRRGTWRLVGTFVGSGVAALIGLLHLGIGATLAATLGLLFLTYAVQDAQYGLYTGVMTTWLVVMLGLGEHFEPVVAWHRAVFTLLGGVLAVVVEWPRGILGRRRPASTDATNVGP